MARGTIVVRAVWDTEAEVFVATSADVPGLIAEATSIVLLQKKLDVLIPELLELNSDPMLDDDEVVYEEVPLFVISESFSKIKIRAHG